MECRRTARDHARLEHLEQLLACCAEADRSLHVRDELGLLGAAEREKRDRDELPHLGRHVLAVAEAELVDPVVGLDEVRISARRVLPLRIDVAAGFLHPRDERLYPLRPILVRRLVLWHRSPPRAPIVPCRAPRPARLPRPLRSGRRRPRPPY